MFNSFYSLVLRVVLCELLVGVGSLGCYESWGVAKGEDLVSQFDGCCC